MKMAHACLLSSLTGLALSLPTSARDFQNSELDPKIIITEEARARNDDPPYSPSPTSRGCQISQNNSATYCVPPITSNANLTDTYLCGDWRLGPKKLPTLIIVEELVDFYHRFGPLCPAEFLAKYWDATAGYWIYPDHDGFSLDNEGRPITGNYTLQVGTLVDRFGSSGGEFVSPAVSPYIERALPPGNLDTPQSDPRIPSNYHLYSVEMPFTVEAGPIAPWFEQPGQGVQYHLPNGKSVQDLVDTGYLVERDPLELLDTSGPTWGR